MLGGITVSLALFALIWLVRAWYEQSRLGANVFDETEQYSILRGPWPLLVDALALAAVNIATLLLAGRPWGVTSAFALWGAKFASAMGVDVFSWSYWQRPAQSAAVWAAASDHISV